MERIVLEAQRLLAYSNMTVGGVAESLDFSEPTNFVKFFRKATGHTPAQWRTMCNRGWLWVAASARPNGGT